MTIEITNPMTPISKTPIADNLAIFLNSSMLGFLSICHTLEHFAKNNFNFSIAAMKIRWMRGF